MNNTKLSIVTTVYNDKKNVLPLVYSINENSQKVCDNYEIILVDDFSTDGSREEIKKVCKNDKRLKAVFLSKNHGQQIAMSIGIEHASGEAIIIMDGDLQNPPEAIPDLYSKLSEGCDIVYTVSNTRNTWFDKTTSKFFWVIMSKIFKVNIIKNQLMMKCFTKDIAGIYSKYNEEVRTVAGIVHDISWNHIILEVENKKRTLGVSHYSFLKRIDLMIDIIISLSTAPLNFMIYSGLSLFIITILYSAVILINYFINEIDPGYTSVVLLISILGSINIFFLGFIGRYLAVIYKEVRKRPLYKISNTINFGGKRESLHRFSKK